MLNAGGPSHEYESQIFAHLLLIDLVTCSIVLLLIDLSLKISTTTLSDPRVSLGHVWLCASISTPFRDGNRSPPQTHANVALSDDVAEVMRNG